MYLQVQVNLAEILSERETISRTVQTALDNESLGSQSRACRDKGLPVQLQRAMATEAEAAREARAEVIAAEGKMRASHSLKEASNVISTSPTTLQASPFTVRRAALRSRASKRIRIMAQPKFLTKKYDPAVLLENLKLAATKNMRANVSDLLVKVRKSRYQRYRVFCNARQEREARKKRRRMAKLRKALTKPEDWQRHMRVLERLAAPKVVVRPKKKKPKKKKIRPIDIERINFLALPIAREIPKIKDPLMVSREALTYRITKRIERLAVEKERPEIKLRIPGAVAPAAMKAIASERIITLAKPVQRPAGMQTDLREDAFVVSPEALTARCSRRLKNLAKPRKYPKPVFKRLKTALKR